MAKLRCQALLAKWTWPPSLSVALSFQLIGSNRLAHFFSLKGCNISAQGNALGTEGRSTAEPCRGVTAHMQGSCAPSGLGDFLFRPIPRALPWAELSRPFRASEPATAYPQIN